MPATAWFSGVGARGIGAVGVLVALLLELAACSLLLAQPPLVAVWIGYGAGHALASLLLAVCGSRLLPCGHRQPERWSVALLFAVAFFVPLLGAVGLLAAVLPALYRPLHRPAPDYRFTAIPPLPFRPRQRCNSPLFNDGGLHDVLCRAIDPERRLTALLATRRMPGTQAVPLLRQALGDTADDVRLLAYAMLERLESPLNRRIRDTLAQLENAPVAAHAALHARLANDYWELAYPGLVQGSVLAHVLTQARRHAEQALAAGERLQLLAARIALKQGDWPQAHAWLQAARLAGIDSRQLLPLWAELAFCERRYQAIPALLAALPEEMAARSPFLELVRFWR